MKYQLDSPEAHAIEQQKERIKDLVTAINEFARANGLDPQADHDAVWAMARRKRPDLFPRPLTQ
jgi:hypothetical protein